MKPSTLLFGLTASAAAQKAGEVADCSYLPVGSAPIQDPNSVGSFVNDEWYTEQALNATTPQGYIKSFENLDAAAVQPDTYITARTLASYDTEQCAKACDGELGCRAFNFYVIRTPTQQPGPACPNPPASASFRCALYYTPIFIYQATNKGQERGPNDALGSPFEVKIRGSNGYNANKGYGAIDTTTVHQHHTTTTTEYVNLAQPTAVVPVPSTVTVVSTVTVAPTA